MSDAVALDQPGRLTKRQTLVILSGLMLGLLMAALDQTIVATALPTIVGDLGGLSHLSWIVTAYLLAQTVCTPIYGKLGDLFGRKRLFQIAIVLFLVGSVLCGLAGSMLQLIVFRGIQGLGGGGIVVLTQAIVADVVPPRERGKYQGYFGAVFASASVAGPLLGGLLTDHISWRWVFYVNIPVGIAALVVTSLVLPAAGKRRQAKIDWAGSFLLTGAICSLVLLTTWGGTEHAWGSPVILGLVAATVVLGVGFVLVQRVAAEPTIPLRLLRIRTFNLCCGIGFAMGLAMFGAITFLPTFLQIASGATASSSGLAIIPLMLGIVSSSIVAGQTISRTGHYRVFPILGTGITGVGMVLLSTLDASSSRWESGGYMVVLGVGIGMVLQIILLLPQNEVPPGDIGVATSSVNFTRAVGGSIGVALFGALLNNQLTSRLGGAAVDYATLTPEVVKALPVGEQAEVIDAFAGSITSVFLQIVPVLVIGFALAWLIKEKPLPTHSPAERRGGTLGSALAEAEEGLGAISDPAFVLDTGEASDTGGERDGRPART
jgi:EmrB/QacA subfamily drug resistance transporter